MQKNITSMTIGGCPVTLCGEASFPGCLFVLVGRNQLVQAQSLTSDICDHILTVCEVLQKKGNVPAGNLRISCLQLDLPLERWSRIGEQHHSLMQQAKKYYSNTSWAHLDLPTESLILKADPSRFTEFDSKAADTLVHYFNTEGWVNYCQWIGDEMRKALKRFMPDALDEYQLQARLEDFLHELTSTILADVRKSIETALREQESSEVKENPKKLLIYEKVIVAGREKLIRLLTTQWHLLGDVVEGIGKIEAGHPELVSLKVAAHLLHTLMGQQLDIPKAARLSWAQRLLLLQLLDQQLQVVSVILGEAGDGKGNIVFAIRAALSELSHTKSIDTLMTLSQTWSENNRGNHDAESLRKFVIASSKGLFEPSTGSMPNVWGYNPDLITFLPQKIRVHIGSSERDIVLLKMDQDQAIVLTPEGKNLLDRLNIL